MAYVCKYCGKSLKSKKSLKRHEEETCPERSKGEKPPVVKVSTFEVKKPPEKKPTSERGYHHIDCGGPLEKGQTPCPTCGKEVDWGVMK